jgi:predicted MFS family arabinose efflux permease
MRFPPRQFATMAGVVLGLGTLGNILAATPLVLLVEALGWRRAFLVIAVATAALAALFWALVREVPVGAAPPETRHADPAAGAPASTGAQARLLLRSRDYWLISLGAFCRYGTFAAIQGLWIGPWLVDVAGRSPVGAANLILVMNVGLALGAPLGGWLSDHVLASRKRLALLGLGALAAAELALAFLGQGTGWWTIAVVLAILGVASAFGQVLYAHVKDVMPEGMAGMAMTGVNFFVMLGAAAFLHVMGWILDARSLPGGARSAAGYEAAFLLAGVSTAVAFLAYFLTRDPRPSGR